MRYDRCGWWLLAVTLLGCAPAEGPALDPSAWEGQTPVNPTDDEGRLLYRGFGDHHPDCFVFTGEEGETETVHCPGNVLSLLEGCPAGKLYAPEGKPCICVPLDGPAAEVSCPE